MGSRDPERDAVFSRGKDARAAGLFMHPWNKRETAVPSNRLYGNALERGRGTPS